MMRPFKAVGLGSSPSQFISFGFGAMLPLNVSALPQHGGDPVAGLEPLSPWNQAEKRLNRAVREGFETLGTLLRYNALAKRMIERTIGSIASRPSATGTVALPRSLPQLENGSPRA
jgi:hypothetical protein